VTPHSALTVIYPVTFANDLELPGFVTEEGSPLKHTFQGRRENV